MPRSNIANFSSGTLLTGGNNAGSPRNMTNVDTQFMLQTGQGALFTTVSSALTLPYQPGSFVVCIDSELIVCSARSGDLFTVWSDGSGHTGRGFDGTTAAAHTSNSAVVVQAWPAASVNHLWGVVGDTSNADVPPWATGSLVNGLWNFTAGGVQATVNDDEFESQGSWTVFPLTSNLSGGSDTGAVIDFHTSYRSNLHFKRSTSSPNTTSYYVYKSLSGLSAPYVVACRISHGGRHFGSPNNLSYILEATLGVSDQSNPTGGDVGNAIRLSNHIGNDTGVYGFWPSSGGSPALNWSPYIRSERVASAVASTESWKPYLGERYYAIRNDGSSKPWTTWVSHDGLTWRHLNTSAESGFTPSTVFFRFTAGSGWASQAAMHQAEVDWMRVQSW